MSSIYQKGRDGLFFIIKLMCIIKVQEKKDKKVFHALKTKDREELN